MSSENKIENNNENHNENVNNIEITVNVVANPEDKKEEPEVKAPEENKEEHVIEAYLSIVYDSLCDIIENGHLTVLDTATIVLGLMQVVEELDGLHGAQKKALILKALEKYDVEHPDDENLLTASLEGFVNAFVDIEKGEVVIKVKPAGCIDACFKCLLSPAKKKRIQRAKKVQRKKALLVQKEALEKEMAELDGKTQ